MRPFDLKQFSVAPAAPTLITGVGQDGDTRMFVEKFGERWRKTPTKEGQSQRCWYIAADGAQATYQLGDPQFGIYDYDTVAEFKEAFEQRTHVANCVYVDIDEIRFKSHGVQLLHIFRERGML